MSGIIPVIPDIKFSVTLHDAKVIGLNGGLQGSRSLVHRFVRG